MATEGFEARLQGLEGHAATTEARLNNVERTLDNHGQKLDRIVSAVTTANAKSFEPAAILSFVKDAAILIGLIVGGIIYVATNISATSIALLDARLERIESTVNSVTIVSKTNAQ